MKLSLIDESGRRIVLAEQTDDFRVEILNEFDCPFIPRLRQFLVAADWKSIKLEIDGATKGVDSDAVGPEVHELRGAVKAAIHVLQLARVNWHCSDKVDEAISSLDKVLGES